MSGADLLALAERCENATGPDRELDGAIWALFPNYRASLSRASGLWPKGLSEAQRMQRATAHAERAAPRYTASLDAAMMLKEGVGVLITLSEIKGDGMPYCVIGNPETAELFEAAAATPALALCAAALRARASTNPNNNEGPGGT